MLTIVQHGGASREKPPELVRGQACRLPWAWDGLCFAVPMHEASSQYGIRDIVNNVAPDIQSGVTWTKDDRGNPAIDLGITDYIEYPDTPRHDQPTTEVTAYARLRRNGTPDSFGGIFTNMYDFNGSPWLSWGILQNGANLGSLQGIITLGSTPTVFGDAANVIGTTDYFNAFLRWRSTEAPSLTVLGDRGNLINTYTHTSILTGTIGYAAGQPIRINADQILEENYSGRYSQCLAWSRRLSDTEITALVADPYGWYSPRRETVGLSSPYPLAFGGGELKHGTGIGGLR